MLSELFDFVLNNYIKAKSEQSFAGHPLGECVRSTIPGILRSEHCANNEYVIKGSIGQGAWATVPWIAIMNKGITTTTQNGVYLVYLFSADGDRVFLTLNQGCTDLINKCGRKKTLSLLADTANELRTELQITAAHFADGKGIMTGNDYYDAGCIAYVEYLKGRIPDDKTLYSDLNAFCKYYERYVQELTYQDSSNNACSKQPKWTKYEAAILLDAYIQSRTGEHPEGYYIQNVSNELRQMAINQRLEIDDAYRSVAGITFQMKSMASAYLGITLVKKASKLFSEVVEIFRSNPREWNTLLSNAKELATPSNSRSQVANTSPVVSELEDEKIPNVAMTATQRRLYQSIVHENFPRGFNLEAPSDLTKFKEYYLSKRGIEIKAADSSILTRLAWLGKYYDLRVYGSLTSALKNTPTSSQHTAQTLDRRPITKPSVENEIVSILNENRIPYSRTGNYIFIKKHEIASDVLRKIRASEQTISVTSFSNRSVSCWRVRFAEKFIPSGAKKNSDITKPSNPLEEKSAVAPAAIEKSRVDERIVNVLRKHYEYGYNYNSPIELMRFRKYYESDIGSACALEDEALKKEIKLAGFEFEGKVYLLSDKLESRVKDTLLSEINSGVKLFYISELYSKHEDWLFEENVVDQGMLLALIKKLFPDLYFKQTHFFVGGYKVNETPAIGEEIKRVWGTGALQTYSELKKLLPYIPFDKIKYALSANSAFVWNAFETYTRKDYFRISEQEINRIKETVEAACCENGNISFDDIDLENVAAENYELSSSAIKDLVFSHLSEDYERNQQIITKKGEKQDTSTAIIDYCRKCESCTLSELETVMKSVSGTVRLPVIIEAANLSMVRISEEKFVSDSKVYFNVEQIDSALDNAIHGESIGMREISTFGSFPFCGYAWNLFLLESYSRRFSKKYRYMAIAANSRNAGSIVKKDCELDYHEIMALSVAKSDVELVEDEVFNYLIATGYLARRQYSDIDDLIERAEAIRERGN